MDIIEIKNMESNISKSLKRKRSYDETFDFPTLPYVCQRRFAEICDPRTLKTFASINQNTRNLVKRCHFIKDVKIDRTEEMQKEIKNLKEEIKSLHSQMGMIQKMFEKMQESNKFLEEKVSALQEKGEHQLSPKPKNTIPFNHERRPVVGDKFSNVRNQPEMVSENNGKINSRINDRKRRSESTEDESSSDDQESCDSDTTSENNKSPTKKRICQKENDLKIVEAPNFKVYEKKYGEKIRRRIIVYKDEEKKIGYEYSWNEQRKYFRCLPCETEHKIIVRANLIKNHDKEDDHIELGDVEHQCEPYYLSKNDKKIIKPPRFKIYETIHQGETFRRLMVFTNASKKYGYNLSWSKRAKSFLCIKCRDNISVFAKHIENDGNEYLELSEQAHECKPVITSKFIKSNA